MRMGAATISHILISTGQEKAVGYAEPTARINQDFFNGVLTSPFFGVPSSFNVLHTLGSGMS